MEDVPRTTRFLYDGLVRSCFHEGLRVRSKVA